MSLQEMVVRLRFSPGPAVRPQAPKNRHVALAAAALLTPAVLTALALGFWKLAADLGAAGKFAIENGLFSHWQVWFAIAAVIQGSVSALNRYGMSKQSARNLRNSEDRERQKILDSEFSTSERRLG